MRVLHTSSPALAGMAVLAMVTISACGGSSSSPGSLAAGNGGAQSTPPAAAGGNGASNNSSGQCSDPNPSNLALTFAAIVCVQNQSSVPQSDGSTELKLVVKITDKDPNAIHVTSSDFNVLDAVGHDVSAESPAMATASGRTGANDCIYQDLSEDGFPLAPEKSLTVPGPYCFNLQQGQQAKQLVWQGDVSVSLA